MRYRLQLKRQIWLCFYVNYGKTYCTCTSLSTNIVLYPAFKKHNAIPWPITPAPITAHVLKRRIKDKSFDTGKKYLGYES